MGHAEKVERHGGKNWSALKARGGCVSWRRMLTLSKEVKVKWKDIEPVLEAD